MELSNHSRFCQTPDSLNLAEPYTSSTALYLSLRYFIWLLPWPDWFGFRLQGLPMRARQPEWRFNDNKLFCREKMWNYSDCGEIQDKKAMQSNSWAQTWRNQNWLCISDFLVTGKTWRSGRDGPGVMRYFDLKEWVSRVKWWVRDNPNNLNCMNRSYSSPKSALCDGFNSQNYLGWFKLPAVVT